MDISQNKNLYTKTSIIHKQDTNYMECQDIHNILNNSSENIFYSYVNKENRSEKKKQLQLTYISF